MKTLILLLVLQIAFTLASESQDCDFFDEGCRVSNVTKMDCLMRTSWRKGKSCCLINGIINQDLITECISIIRGEKRMSTIQYIKNTFSNEVKEMNISCTGHSLFYEWMIVILIIVLLF